MTLGKDSGEYQSLDKCRASAPDNVYIVIDLIKDFMPVNTDTV